MGVFCLPKTLLEFPRQSTCIQSYNNTAGGGPISYRHDLWRMDHSSLNLDVAGQYIFLRGYPHQQYSPAHHQGWGTVCPPPPQVIQWTVSEQIRTWPRQVFGMFWLVKVQMTDKESYIALTVFKTTILENKMIDAGHLMISVEINHNYVNKR